MRDYHVSELSEVVVAYCRVGMHHEGLFHWLSAELCQRELSVLKVPIRAIRVNMIH